jgi:hypothetical protein
LQQPSIDQGVRGTVLRPAAAHQSDQPTFTLAPASHALTAGQGRCPRSHPYRRPGILFAAKDLPAGRDPSPLRRHSAGEAIMASPRDAARLRHGLNPLTTTSLATYGNHVNSPISAVSMASSHIQSAQTPGSAIQPYNPQEWVPSPAQMPDRSRQFSPEAGQGMGISFKFTCPSLHRVFMGRLT